MLMQSGNILEGEQNSLMGCTFTLTLMEYKLKTHRSEAHYQRLCARHEAPRKQFIKAGGKLYYLDDDNKISSSYKN